MGGSLIEWTNDGVGTAATEVSLGVKSAAAAESLLSMPRTAFWIARFAVSI
jgi:hypothetical protein